VQVETAGSSVLLVQRAVDRPEQTCLVALGDAGPVAALLRAHDVRTHRFAWVETAALAQLRPDDTARWGLTPNRTGWEWLVADAAPPAVAAESAVRELDPARDAGVIRACLAESNPSTDADPARPGERWWGIGEGEHLVGVIGATPRAGRTGGRGSFHLHGLGVRPGERSRGLGAGLTAAALRALLGSGADWVSLGMWDDNDGARRIYHRLGLRTVHRLTTLRRA
jgi:ribosomal protein S18 acetylase RimI-like enzyme